MKKKIKVSEGAQIIKFPRNRIKRIPPTLQSEEVEEAKKRASQVFANDITDNIIKRIVQEYKIAGLNIAQDPDQFDKDLSFAVEAVRAMTFRLLKIKHHLHPFVDANIKLVAMEAIDIEHQNDKQIEEETAILFSPDFPFDDDPKEPA